MNPGAPDPAASTAPGTDAAGTRRPMHPATAARIAEILTTRDGLNRHHLDVRRPNPVGVHLRLYRRAVWGRLRSALRRL